MEQLMKTDHVADAETDKLLEESSAKPKSTEGNGATKKEKGSKNKKGDGVDTELEALELLQDIADAPTEYTTKEIPFDPELEDLLQDIDASPQSKVSTQKAKAVLPDIELEVLDDLPDEPGYTFEPQHYYDIIAEKVGTEVAEIVVWEGAAKNKNIKSHLKTLVDEEGYLDENGSEQVAKLFSSQLTTEKKIRERFLPNLKTVATCKWYSFSAGVAAYLFLMLLHKMPQRGLSLFTSTVPKEVYYQVIGEAVTKVFFNTWPKVLVKMPKPDKFLSPEDFKDLLVQDPKSLGIGHRGELSWISLLAYSPESIHGEIVENLKEMPWSDVFVELARLFDYMESHHPDMLIRAGIRLVKTWGDATTLESRKATLKQLQMGDNLDHKEFEKMLDLIITTATFSLEDLKGSKDDPCLLVTSPTTQLAVKLFQYTIQTMGEIDINETMKSLIEQNIGDRKLAAVLRVMANMKLLDGKLAEELIYVCSSEGLLESCAELLRVVPNPRLHPIIDILKERDEDTCYRALEVLTPDLYAPNCHDYINDSNPLHIAATFGYTSVCKKILARGFHRLLERSGHPSVYIDDTQRRPASIAAQTKHFATAKELLQAMDPENAKQLFTGRKPEIDLHQVIDEISKKRGVRWTMEAKEEGKWKPIQHRLERKEIEERMDFFNTALDTAVQSRHVDLTVLIRDEHGKISEQFRGGEEKKPDLEQIRKKSVDLTVLIQDEPVQISEESSSESSSWHSDIDGEEKKPNLEQDRKKTLYSKIANSDCEELKSHECFVTLTNIIWNDYGIVQGMLFSLYLLFMAFLTTALVLAARSGDPSEYDDSLDWFRLFCEVVTLLWILYDLTLEFYQLGQVVYRSLKQHPLCVRHEPQTLQQIYTSTVLDPELAYNESKEDVNDEDGEDDNANPFLAVTKDIVVDYFLDWQNILDDLAILCVLLIIPFRILDSDNQWIFAALALMFHGLRIFKYAIMFKSVGEYVAILVLLIKRDIPQFVAVFLVIIFSLGGALYLALIGHYNESNIATENNNDTSEVYLLWWTGIRILAEGSALTYYGPGGFNWLGILIYWLFLFIVVVVLLNILIAQFSKSYEEESERAQINVILIRTEIILKMEQSILTRPCVRFVRRMMTKLTNNSLVYERVERLSVAVERDEKKPASSEQVEELQTQTTNLRLQLRKQMDDNTGKSTLKAEEMKAAIGTLGRETQEALQVIEGKLVGLERAGIDTREALQVMKAEIEGKLVGLERAVIDTRHYVDEIKDILLSIKEKK